MTDPTTRGISNRSGERQLWDISRPIRPGIPVWPGDTPYAEARTWTIGPGCPVNVSEMTMSTHTGTHVDAPLHYDPDGAPVAALDLARFLGPCRLIDLAHLRDATLRRIEPKHISALLEGAVRVLFRTYDRAPIDRWDPGFTVIDPATIDLLAGRGVILVGVDAPSIDPESSKTLDAHQAARRHGLSILEGLVLDMVPAGDYELIALPLPLANLDASPVRAVLRTLGPTA
jgi:arylformamidase